MSDRSERRRSHLSLIALVAVLACTSAGRVPAVVTPSQAGRVITVERLDDGGGCRPTDLWEGCTLRAAVELAGDAPLRIELPPARLIHSIAEPIKVHGTVTIIGAGPHRSVIDGNELTRVFRVLPGAKLTLEDLSVVRGGPGPPAVPRSGTVTFRNVFLGDGASAPPPPDERVPYFCTTTGPILERYLRSAEVTDDTALHYLPGRGF